MLSMGQSLELAGFVTIVEGVDIIVFGLVSLHPLFPLLSVFIK